LQATPWFEDGVLQLVKNAKENEKEHQQLG
jgi:hypothetical protein